MSGNTREPGMSVASRVLALLGAFDPGHRCLRLTDLAARAGLPVSTTHRLAAELETWGALRRYPDGTYVIGRRMWDVGMLAPAQSGIRETAAPFLHDLYAATLATVHLAVRVEHEVLYLDRLGGRTSVPVVSRVGARLPLHATAVGKVLLAYAPTHIQTHVLSRLKRITPHTVVAPGALVEQLERVQREGFATTVEEMSPGACSVAVPIRDASEVVAALGVVVPALKRNREQLVAALQVAAQGIGRSLPPNGNPRSKYAV